MGLGQGASFRAGKEGEGSSRVRCSAKDTRMEGQSFDREMIGPHGVATAELLCLHQAPELEITIG